MDLLVERADVWAATIQDKPGALAEVLDALRRAGADLQFIIARRTPENSGTGVVFVTPLQNDREIRIAAQVGFNVSQSLHSVRVLGTDQPGVDTETGGRRNQSARLLGLRDRYTVRCLRRIRYAWRCEQSNGDPARRLNAGGDATFYRPSGTAFRTKKGTGGDGLCRGPRGHWLCAALLLQSANLSASRRLLRDCCMQNDTASEGNGVRNRTLTYLHRGTAPYLRFTNNSYPHCYPLSAANDARHGKPTANSNR
jgi:hypothetical protein